MITVLNPFTIDPDLHSDSHSLECLDESKTVQADLQQSDINFIVKQFGLTHELPYGQQVPVFADYADIPNDYHAAKNFMMDAEHAFMQMPAEQRSRFDNDPGKLLAFLADDANRKAAEELGFVPRPSPLPNPAEPPIPTPSPDPAQAPGKEAAGGS